MKLGFFVCLFFTQVTLGTILAWSQGRACPSTLWSPEPQQGEDRILATNAPLSGARAHSSLWKHISDCQSAVSRNLGSPGTQAGPLTLRKATARVSEARRLCRSEPAARLPARGPRARSGRGVGGREARRGGGGERPGAGRGQPTRGLTHTRTERPESVRRKPARHGARSRDLPRPPSCVPGPRPHTRRSAASAATATPAAPPMNLLPLLGECAAREAAGPGAGTG